MDMYVTRLSWAGLRVETAATRLLIDPFETVESVRPLGLLNPREQIVPAAGAGEIDACLITHVHPDHFDPLVIRRVLKRDGMVYCPSAMLAVAEQAELPARAIDADDRFRVGDIDVAAVPASDGFGEHQLSWVVRAHGRTIFHGGDTLWHGSWWRIDQEYGPVDLAFLPVNGVLVQIPGVVSSGVPATLTPLQAAAAAAVLRAGAICPIHYGMFHEPPAYSEFPDALAALHAAAAERDLLVTPVPAGCSVAWPGRTRGGEAGRR